MFDQTFVDAPARPRTPWTVAASVTAQAAFLAALLIVPLLRPELLTLRKEMPVYLPVQLKQAPPQVQAASATQQQRPSTVPRAFVQPNPLRAPVDIPRTIDTSADALPPGLAISSGAIPGPASSDGLVGVPTNFVVERPKPKEQPAVVKEPPQPAAGPQIVGGDVQASKLIFGPRPVYPPIARSTRIQGTVRLQAVIAADGHIQNLRVVSGHPLLTRAALDAVAQWRYSPTLLNGKPVEVITEIQVNFTLAGN